MTSVCEVCGEPKHSRAVMCRRCNRLRTRLETRKGGKADFAARTAAMKQSWSPEQRAFVCYYSKVALVDVDSSNPRYPVFDHRSPRDESDVVVCANLVNRMKTDLEEDEFRRLIMSLADLFRGKREALSESDFVLRTRKRATR